MNWRDPEFRRNLLVLGSWKNKRGRRRLIGAIYAGLILVILGLYWSGTPMATNPVLCGQFCHPTYAEYQSWLQSSHSSVPCHLCHLDTPTQKLVNPITRFVQAQFDSFEKPLNADSEFSQKGVDKARCLRCHAENAPMQGKKPVPRPQGPMHDAHLAMDMDCTVCHNRIAHSGAERFEPIRSWTPDFKYKDFVTMREGCWRCHSLDGQWRNEETLKLVAGKTPPTECRTCHDASWPLMPRVGSIDHGDVKGVAWRSGDRHGKEAQKDFFACLGCHDRAKRPARSKNPPDCSDACHGGTVMPHNTPAWNKYYLTSGEATEDGWIQVHPKAAASGGVIRTAAGRAVDSAKVCSRCHGRGEKTDNLCDDCHHLDIINGAPKAIAKEILAAGTSWRRQHPQAVKKMGTEKCGRCHTLEFCSNCHTKARSQDI